MSFVRIQIIGDCFEVLRYPLIWRGIKIENIIRNCSPLAMVGHKDSRIAAQSEGINSVPMQLMAKGNLAQMLSHEEFFFCDNFKLPEMGSIVRNKNESEYIVICNDLCAYGLYSYRGSIYSDTYPKNELLYAITNEPDCAPLSLPYTFNWEELYDAFIDAILGEYDSEHIILVRTNVMRWRIAGGKFVAFEGNTCDLRNQIERMDVRFAERSGCHCVDIMYAHIPNDAPYAFDVFPSFGEKSTPYTLKCTAKTSSMYKELEYALDDIINRKSEIYRYSACPYHAPLAQKLHRRLSRDVLVRNQDALNQLESASATNLSTLDEDSDFVRNLHKLSRFIDGEQRYSLSDYTAEHMQTPLTDDCIGLLELASEYLKLGLDEIVSLYQLYLICGDKSRMRGLVSRLCANSDCYPLSSTRQLVRRNLDRLADYRYIERELLPTKLSGYYIRLDDGCLLALDANSDEPMRLIHTDVKTEKSLDYKHVITDGYICTIGEADALCCDWSFYIARARAGKGNDPITIRFNSPEDFALSLAYVDYTDLLESEPFVLTCAQPLSDFPLEEFQARTDLSFLFEKGTRLQFIGRGLADEMSFYLHSKWIDEKCGGMTYYDDVVSVGYGGHAEAMLPQVIKESIQERQLSKLLSHKLISRIKYHAVADRLYLHGLTELFSILNYNALISLTNACPYVYIPQTWSEKLFRASKYGVQYSFCFVVDKVSGDFVKLAEKYIAFPKYAKADLNIQVATSMSVCDAVVIHVRRGDFITCTRAADSAFYQEAMGKLKAIPAYPNKRFFVFSDDIPWCRTHLSELGFDIFPDADIIFVDFNRNENSFRDMQLMSYGKVLIGPPSGFFLTAAALAKHCEVFMCSDKNKEQIYVRDIRKNKY